MAAWRWGVTIMALAVADMAQAQVVAAQPQPVAQTPEQLARQAAAREERLRQQREREARRARAMADADRALRRWTAAELTPFRDEDDFSRYLAAVKRRYTAEYAAANALRIQFAQTSAGTQTDAPAAICGPENKECLRLRDEAMSGENIVVTGSRIQVPPLTNNQEQGIDEGDVVKQIGQYLLVLQDGRIFVIDTEAGPQRNALRLVDRANVYRNAEDDAWYDELVVEGNRIVVTGYAYEADASELAIFRLGDGGRLTREAVFQIKSEDYYDRNNYASRLIGDELILYTPIALSDRNDGGAFNWPTLRRAPIEGGEAQGEGALLLRPHQLYRPLSTLSEPVIHLVTRCRLGEPGSDLGCTSQGFVASRSREFYVAGDGAYLWSYANNWDYPDDDVPFCAADYRPTRGEADRSLVHRLSLSGAPMGVVGTTGGPMDQLGIDASDGRFRALIAWWRQSCRIGKTMPLHYFEISDSLFARRLRQAPDSAFTPMPDIEANMIENRFTDQYLVFGGRVVSPDGRDDDDDDEENETIFGGGNAVVVPISRPGEARPVWLPHRVWRVERIGNNAALTGYAGARGLDVSVIDLSGAAPRLSDTLRLEGRAETEGRSHAFNSLIGADGTGLMGLPTVQRIGGTDRYAWRSAASDLSFLSVDAAGRLQSLGALATQAQGSDRRRWYAHDDVPADPAIYSCQVSCIAWYGNSRPLFTRGRVFALTGTELVEGRVADGRIGELQRIDLTKELPEHLRTARSGADEGAAPPKE